MDRNNAISSAYKINLCAGFPNLISDYSLGDVNIHVEIDQKMISSAEAKPKLNGSKTFSWVDCGCGQVPGPK